MTDHTDTALDIRQRPGKRLLAILAERGDISLGDFAVAAGMGSTRDNALTAAKKYTHVLAGDPSRIKWPGPAMIARWAKALGVDPGEFYRSTPS